MFFQKIKGHEEILDRFKDWLLQDKFEGVYLFEGPRGVGKYTIARYLAKYLTCTGVMDDSCFCDNCKLFPNVPDYLEISSDEESIIKVSDVDNIEAFVPLMPYRSKKRVVLIDDAERLNNTSASQLLKTLEEVKNHTVFFLISSRPEKIIHTVLSRSISIQFSSLHPSMIAEILKEKEISSNKFGDVNKMLPFLSHSVLANYTTYLSYVGYVQDYLVDFAKKDEDDLLSIVSNVDTEGNLIYFLEIFHIYICDLLRISLDDRNTVFNSEHPQIYDKMVLDWKRDMCVFALDKIRPIILDYKKGVNIKLRSRVESLISWLFLMMKKSKGIANEKT
jgi:DNA polymerase-3 subunit delta'